MEPSQEFRIAQHNSLQDLANHYDSINWNMHTIFVTSHVALVGWLVISMAPPCGLLWKDLPGALIGLSASIAGCCLAEAWRRSFERHRLFIKTLYQRLRAIETSLTNGDGDLANFKVHTLIRPAIAASRKNRKGNEPTSAVILGIHGWLTVGYFAIGLVALVRALLFIFSSAFDQLNSCLLATVG